MRHTLNLPRELRDILASNRKKRGLTDHENDDAHFALWLEGQNLDKKLNIEQANFISAVAYTAGCTKLCVIVSLAESHNSANMVSSVRQGRDKFSGTEPK